MPFSYDAADNTYPWDMPLDADESDDRCQRCADGVQADGSVLCAECLAEVHPPCAECGADLIDEPHAVTCSRNNDQDPHAAYEPCDEEEAEK